ncbi:putative transcription factor, MBF1 like protein [Belliella baltica DSM 15883]|uniref:Putative transcription factor, MBF1 like protein n=1 Tax=Belliella baltica (strain DSM 15883 / CIP 108006 / LMG 21964 / BA134) TaxID=866536 RepID=I3Z6D8_BELBD|nr:helix-turn-helix transcriptional regulator [Belliella baltica]AFL84806.1 putative transcription factor, MBF1 like protein [Belliella baltica DSM 15883]
MKQPELGLKIQEWRKAKGLTQEELVERCNLNVRTIQRIEAGEVTPRSYTIKAIMEVLDVSHVEALDYLPKQEEMNFSSLSKKIFLLAGIAGIIYFFISIIEFYWDGSVFMESGIELPDYYVVLKVFVFISLFFYVFGFVRLGKELGSKLIQIGSILFIIINLGIIGADIFYSEQYLMDYKLFGVFKIFSLGVSLIPLSIGLISVQNKMGSIFLVAGVVGLFTALLFCTVLFSMYGLILLTAFDILCIYLLFSIYSKKEYFNGAENENGTLVLS